VLIDRTDRKMEKRCNLFNHEAVFDHVADLHFFGGKRRKGLIIQRALCFGNLFDARFNETYHFGLVSHMR